MKTVLLTERDMALLKSLWRWKLLSTAALTEAFFCDRSPITAYVRLWHLKEGHFIQLVSESGGKDFFWCLAPKGFGAIENSLPELAEAGFKSENIQHDALVTAVHLGDWLRAAPKGAETFTEQELRRCHADHYPSWIPKTLDHRPDGYWLVPREGKEITIALEVEINRKRDRFYRQVAHFYDRHPEIHRVVWLVTTRAAAASMQQLLTGEVGERASIHEFITRNDFEKNGWQSLILLGAEAGKPLAFLLDPLAQTSLIPVWTRFLLDSRKCPHRSKGYQNLKAITFRDRGVYGAKFNGEGNI